MFPMGDAPAGRQPAAVSVWVCRTGSGNIQAWLELTVEGRVQTLAEAHAPGAAGRRLPGCQQRSLTMSWETQYLFTESAVLVHKASRKQRESVWLGAVGTKSDRVGGTETLVSSLPEGRSTTVPSVPHLLLTVTQTQI